MLCKPVFEVMGQAIIHIIDDEAPVRAALHKALAAAGHRCRSYESGEQFLEAEVGPRDCVVADMYLPDMSGIALLETLSERGQIAPVLVITGQATIELAVRAMKAGAVDFLAKPFATRDLAEKVDTCLAIGRLRAAERERRQAAAEKLSSLSEREIEVLGVVIEGKTNRAISDILCISVKTVEAHRARIMEKTGALSLIHLTRLWDTAGRSASVGPGQKRRARGDV
ncbi:response regulator transcription factor [Azospirillum halopraeferens]|uniref:response regulator transcription factor n=1 Tax=Azospirillum halopraeferens TaxID=34010 RepID=UPI0003F58640|nr:response regulator [Azospirillum halopraeferens]